MILSVSRRTDIPNYYGEWFINRIREGFLLVKNPMNEHQVSKIILNPDVIDCIVFWTKNPVGIMPYLDELKSYAYYFQFTLNGYETDIEKNLPSKEKELIPRFKELSHKIGKERVVWRYDPIIFTDKYTKEYHLEIFERYAQALCGYTTKCVISFVDIYRKNQSFIKDISLKNYSEAEILEFAKEIQKIATKNGMVVGTCSEQIDLAACGIEHNCCIDKKLIEQIVGCNMEVKKDKNQRPECGCMESIEVGTYNTCKNGCKYCYATYDEKSVRNHVLRYDKTAPILCGELGAGDKVTERKMKSLKDEQITLSSCFGQL